MGLGMMMGSGVPAEAHALFARMSTPPSGARKQQIARLIRSLKQAGVWSKLDALYLFAGADSQAALLNWKSASYNATNNGASFTADRGFTGNGSSAYLATGYTPGDGQFARSNHHFGVLMRTIGAGNEYYMGASGGSGQGLYINCNPSSTGGYSGVAGSSARVGLSGVCHAVLIRAAGDISLYRNGLFAAVTTTTTYTSVPYPVFILGANFSGTPLGFASGRAAAAHMGAALTGPEAAALNAALETYLAAVGA